METDAKDINECNCKCHIPSVDIRHVSPCCILCNTCDKRIKYAFLDDHRKVCN